MQTSPMQLTGVTHGTCTNSNKSVDEPHFFALYKSVYVFSTSIFAFRPGVLSSEVSPSFVIEAVHEAAVISSERSQIFCSNSSHERQLATAHLLRPQQFAIHVHCSETAHRSVRIPSGILSRQSASGLATSILCHARLPSGSSRTIQGMLP